MTAAAPTNGVADETPAPLLGIWPALVVAVAAGAVLDLAFPSVGWWPLAFVGVAMSLVTLVGRSAGGAIAVGAAFAASFYLIHIVWITRYLGPVPWFALAGVETVLSALGAVLLAWAYRWTPSVVRRPWPRLFAVSTLVAGVWTARELFLGSWPYTGFPWGRIGMAFSDSTLAAAASWTSVAGLTFAAVWVSAAGVEAARAARSLSWPAAAPATALAVALAVIPQYATTPSGTMSVGAVQGNGPTGYFDEREPWAILESQLAATEPLLGEDLDLVLWPEGGIEGDPLTNASVARVLDRLSRAADAPLLVNAATTREDELTYNTSILWEAGADNPVAIHDKANPVPMGEYVPDRWFFEALAPDLVGLIQREYTPGTNPPFMDVDGTGVGLAICFDVIYDDVIWEGAALGAQVYMFQTNNADFRDTDENLQQLAFARMRAVETGRSVVNLSTVGTSQVIAPDGSTVDALAAGEAGQMRTDVELRTGLTPAVVAGPAVRAVLLWGSLAALGVVWMIRLRRRRTDAASPATHDDAEPSEGSGIEKS